eukprot:494096-Alexandrium_andersonii.AAC.1
MPRCRCRSLRASTTEAQSVAAEHEATAVKAALSATCLSVCMTRSIAPICQCASAEHGMSWMPNSPKKSTLARLRSAASGSALMIFGRP